MWGRAPRWGSGDRLCVCVVLCVCVERVDEKGGGWVGGGWGGPCPQNQTAARSRTGLGCL